MRKPLVLVALLLPVLLAGRLALAAPAHGEVSAESDSVVTIGVPDASQVPVPLNPSIDMPGYLRVAGEAARWRESHRVTEDEFVRMSREPGTVVLDARGDEKYAELHVKGALHLAFPDIAVATLARMIPDRSTRILIYCNNNFRNAEGPFPSKLPSASLNLSTFIALYSYGYRNVYELGPQLELDHTRLEFESSPPRR